MTPKSARNTAIVSQIFIIVWVFALWIVTLNQDKVIRYFSDVKIDYEFNVMSWSVLVYCVASALLTISNLIMCNDSKFNKNGKVTLVPLVATAVTTAALPIAVRYVDSVQKRLVARVEGTDMLVKLSAYINIVSVISYLVYAAMIMSIASSAVYTYAKTNRKE